METHFYVFSPKYQYFEKFFERTLLEIMERFNGHRADLRTEDESKPAYHFKREEHTEEDMRVIILEHVPGSDDVFRVARERWWINRMGTFEEENKRR